MDCRLIKFLIFLLLSNYTFAINQITISPLNNNIEIKYENQNYKKSVTVDLYMANGNSLEEIYSSFQYAQKKLNKCHIKLKLNKIYTISSYRDFKLWETFTFNNFEITQWEKDFFGTAKKGNKVLFLESLNWSFEGIGTWGFGYASFTQEYFELENKDQLKLFKEKMIGTAVIGKYRAEWTLVHEIAHAVFNIDHTYLPNNIMNPGKMWQDASFDQNNILITDKYPNYDPVFTEEQCKTAINSI